MKEGPKTRIDVRIWRTLSLLVLFWLYAFYFGFVCFILALFVFMCYSLFLKFLF